MVKSIKVDFQFTPADPWKTEWDTLSGTTDELEARQMDARGWYMRNSEYWEEEEAMMEEEEAPEAPVNMVGGGSDVDEDLPEESLLARDPQTGQLVCGDSRSDLGRNMRTHTPTLINSETPLMSMALGGVGSGHDPYRQA